MKPYSCATNPVRDAASVFSFSFWSNELGSRASRSFRMTMTWAVGGMIYVLARPTIHRVGHQDCFDLQWWMDDDQRLPRWRRYGSGWPLFGSSEVRNQTLTNVVLHSGARSPNIMGAPSRLHWTKTPAQKRIFAASIVFPTGHMYSTCWSPMRTKDSSYSKTNWSALSFTKARINAVASTFVDTEGLFITSATPLIAYAISSAPYSLPEWSRERKLHAVANQSVAWFLGRTGVPAK